MVLEKKQYKRKEGKEWFMYNGVTNKSTTAEERHRNTHTLWCLQPHFVMYPVDTVVKVKLKHVTHLTFVVWPLIWDELCPMKRNILYNAFRALDLPSSQQPPQTSRKKHECNHSDHRYYNVLACDLSIWLSVTQSRIMHALTLLFVVSHSSKPYWMHRYKTRRIIKVTGVSSNDETHIWCKG